MSFVIEPVSTSYKLASVSPSDFRLTFADADFYWAGERRPGLPFLRWPDGTLCEPVLAYFGYSAEIARVKISSMKPEAYAIREWLAFVTSRGTRWDEADDLLLRQWRDSQRDGVEAGELEGRQIQRKLDCVFEFYRLLPEALPLDENGDLRRLLVGKNNVRKREIYPITSKMEKGLYDNIREVWSGAESIGQKKVKRPTPNETQVEKILTWLRSKDNRQSSGRFGTDTHQLSLLETERNWLIGRVMSDGGLRAQEASDLTVEAIAKALRSEAVPMPHGTPGKLTGGRQFIDAVSDTPEARTSVLAALDALEARHRRCIYVEITGKGGKTRMAPFTVDLVRDILEVGIWTVRKQQIDTWAARDRRFEVPAQVFLSFKMKGRMQAGTISDIMKDAFNAVGIDGSGHRLRAHYATMMAARLWDEGFAMNGYRFDQTVVNMTLERLAEAMGHSQVTTTVRHYLDMALLKHFGVSNRKRLDAMRDIWNSVMKHQGTLSEEKTKLILKLVNGLASTEDGSDFQQVLAMAVDDPTLNPTNTSGPETQISNPTKKPKLRLI